MLTSPALVAVAVFGLFSIAANSAIRATDRGTSFNPEQLDIRVQANGFGKASALISLQCYSLRPLKFGGTACTFD